MMMSNPMALLGQLKQNPMQFVMQRKMNIPQGIENDPNAILNHLLSSRQVSQERINWAYQVAQQMGIKK